MVKAAGHHRAVAQHPELIPQAIAECLSSYLLCRKIGPLKPLAEFQKDALRQPKAFPHRLPFRRKRPVQRRQDRLVQIVLPCCRTVQIPQPQSRYPSRCRSFSCKCNTLLQISRKPLLPVVCLQTVQRNADLSHRKVGKQHPARLRQQRPVGGDIHPKIQLSGNLQKLRQRRVEQRLPHQMKIKIAGGRAYPLRQKAELRRAHGAGLPLCTGAKAAPQIAPVGDLQIDFIVLPHHAALPYGFSFRL